jgi:EmrB/QacA subfamily drug resistance transporter
MPHCIPGSRRWLALIVLCLGVVMIVLDSTVVNVALPSIRADLGLSETSLVWVVNAYLLSFGGFLLLGGRLGDLYGARRLFLIGIVAFTLASLACGLATSQTPLIWARAIQGLGGAVVDSVSLSLIMNMFTEPGERAKAMGVYGFVCSVGGSLGVLLGGLLTTSLNWHWIFLVNLPIGALVYVLCLWLIPVTGVAEQRGTRRLDVLGAVTVTASSTLAVYAVVNGSEAGWVSKQSIALLSAAAALMVLFLVVESRVRAPLVPLGLFRSRALATANIAAVLWAAACFAWFFICALYLQRVLGHDAMRVSLAFLPANLVMAVLSLGLSAKVVIRFGIKLPFVAGMLIGALGLALFAVAPVNGEVLTDVLPGMILLGLGAGVAFNPLLLAAMGGVPASESGLASGLVNTSFMMGGAIGLAILTSAAAAWTTKLSEAGADPIAALNGGYHVAFALGAACAVGAAVLCAVLLPAGSADRLSAQEGASLP